MVLNPHVSTNSPDETANTVFSSRWRHLWPHSSNQPAMQAALENVLRDYYNWHASLQIPALDPTPADDSLIRQVTDLLRELSLRLQRDSIPWPTPVYLAHMNTDVPLLASLAYFTALLYNPNNVTPEASPVTTDLEYELSDNFCDLFGFDPRQGWGHLTSGGHASNYEAIWIARNLKQVTFALARSSEHRELLSGYSQLQLCNMSPSKVVQLLSLVAQCTSKDALHGCSTTTGLHQGGVIYVAENRHYAWDKCANLLGVKLMPVLVGDAMRMDIFHLREQVLDAIRTGTPIVAVVATVGSSGEGSVDDICGILALRQECEQRFGASFFIHADAAYGGYYRSLLLEPSSERPACTHPSSSPGMQLKSDVADSLRALDGVDTITVDPHKSGYAPYPAGALVIRDRCYSEVVSSRSSYFKQAHGEHMDFGPYTLEGARPGAAAAALWAIHRLLGLHWDGYGSLLAANVRIARQFHHSLNEALPFYINGQAHRFLSLQPPDLGMLNFAVMPSTDGVSDAECISALSEQVIELVHGLSVSLNTPWFSRNRIAFVRVQPDSAHLGDITVVRCCFLKPSLEEHSEALCQHIIRRMRQYLESAPTTMSSRPHPV
jgi:glutamate/tyrosine decarboxylase-like PLP-dependent enzyme